MIMGNVIHLVVESGAEKGMNISVPSEGVRLGRSSKNDIVLLDPKLSRHHCRIFFKEGGGLWITDLGSANGTLVNNRTIQETPLAVNDLITIGDTLIRVVRNSMEAPPIKIAGGKKEVDLGLSAPVQTAHHATIRKKPIITVAVIALAVIIICIAAKFLETGKKGKGPVLNIPAATDIKISQLTIFYEKVEATANNIFRYKLTIDPNNLIAIEIDDIQNNRHLRKEDTVDEKYIQDLATKLLESDFFAMQSEYLGLQPGSYNLWKLTIAVNDKVHTVKVENRLEPPLFKEIREDIEIFGKNELGIWAVQFTTEKLIEMANNEYLQGKKLFDNREVEHGNLWESIRNYKKAELDLETVDPKPDFYADLLTSRTDAENELKKKWEELSFRATREMQLEEWENAARELRIICNMIPDPSDDRHSDARKKLRAVELRMERK